MGLDVGAIGSSSLFGFGSGWTLSIWLLVIIFIKIFSIWLRLSGLEVFQFPHHRQYLFVSRHVAATSTNASSSIGIVHQFINGLTKQVFISLTCLYFDNGTSAEQKNLLSSCVTIEEGRSKIDCFYIFPDQI